MCFVVVAVVFAVVVAVIFVVVVALLFLFFGAKDYRNIISSGSSLVYMGYSRTQTEHSHYMSPKF